MSFQNLNLPTMFPSYTTCCFLQYLGQHLYSTLAWTKLQLVMIVALKLKNFQHDKHHFISGKKNGKVNRVVQKIKFESFNEDNFLIDHGTALHGLSVCGPSYTLEVIYMELILHTLLHFTFGSSSSDCAASTSPSNTPSGLSCRSSTAGSAASLVK
ncbi:hypothetical protein K439DRAFT_1623288 [Ramaria rubella]|nr:hypothetical protein K439DRAFT_1623288 [Ramaria rubella]